MCVRLRVAVCAADDAGVVSFCDTSLSVLETEGPATLRLCRDSMLSVRRVSVLASSANGTAASGEQFTALNSTLAWSTGSYSEQGPRLALRRVMLMACLLWLAGRLAGCRRCERHHSGQRAGVCQRQLFCAIDEPFSRPARVSECWRRCGDGGWTARCAVCA